ncbi:MAG TPA: S41 family peptidase, partial [Candidatus Polarisedimenticolia bacterium]|nr:S41 family peptidase [Candidatus Polarisedimenticolia bacterium]
DRGLIVGTTTWGKGLVQTVYPLSHDAALALTTARYYTPSGRLIQRSYNSLEDYLSHDEKEEDLVNTSKEVRHTDAGRTVYGGGGIRPDVIVDPDTTSKFVDQLERGQIFFHFAVDFNARHKSVPRGFEITPEVLQEFQAFLDKRKVKWSVEEIENNKERLRSEIKEAIASALWGLEEGYKVYAESDRQIQKALELFPQAQQLANLNHGTPPAER